MYICVAVEKKECGSDGNIVMQTNKGEKKVTFGG